MTEQDLVIRISAKNLTAREFEAARKQLDDLGKKAGVTNTSFGQMGKGFQSAASQLASFNPAAAQTTTLLGGFGAAGLAAGAGIGVVALGLRSLAAEGDRLERLSRQTRMSTDELQRMEAVGGRLGITLPELTAASVKLETALGKGGKEVAAAVAAIGFSVSELGSMGATDRLLAVQKGIAGIKDPLLQAEVGAALLGKSWADLRAELSDIEAAQKASENVLRLSENAINAGDNLGDAWGEATRNLKVLMLEGLTPLAEDLASVLESITKSTKAWKEFDDAAPEWLKRGAGRSMPGDIPVPGTFGQLSFGVSPGEQKMIQNAENEQRRKMELAGVNAEIVERILEQHRKKKEEADAKEKERRKKAEQEMADFLEKINEVTLDKLLGDAKDYWANLKQIQMENRDILAMFVPDPQAMQDAFDEALVTLGSGLGGVDSLSTRGRFAVANLSTTMPGVDFSSFGKVADEVGQFGLSLHQASELANIFGDSLGPFGAALLQGAASGELLGKAFDDISDGGLDLANAMDAAIGIMAGATAVWNATGTGGTGSRVAGGAVAGAEAGAAFGPWGAGIGAAAGAITGLIRGLGGPDIGRDVGRDIGANISDELEKAIEESGLNAQLFLKEIFLEGGLGIDRLAEETADLFSMFQRSEISKDSLIGALKEDLPILIEHFAELGATGQEQIKRLTEGAAMVGVELVEVNL